MDREAGSRTLAWDLGFALLVGVAVGASPHTSAHRLATKLVGGLLAGAATLGYRRFALRAAPPPVAVFGRTPPALALLLVAAALAFAPTAVELYRLYTDSIWWNGHGFFVPLVAGALAFAILRREVGGPEATSAWGFAPLLLGLAFVVVDAAAHTLILGALGLPLFCIGLSMLTLGARRTRALALPLALLFFLVPLPPSLAPALALPKATAAGAGAILDAVGTQVERQGPVLWLPYGAYGVSNNCSGFSAFYAGLAFALLLGGCSRSWPRSALLLLAVWPLTWLANVARTTVVVALCGRFGVEFLLTPFHGLSGIATFWLVMGGLWLLADTRAVRKAFA
jgi:exosortase